MNCFLNELCDGNIPDCIEFINVLTKGVRSMAAGSMSSAGISGKAGHTVMLVLELILPLI